MILLRRNDKWLFFDSVNIEVFLVKGNNIAYSCIDCEAYKCGISVIHRQIRVLFDEIFSFFQTRNTGRNYFNH